MEAIDEMQGWISPRLGIRFALEGIDLIVHRPDGRRFESFIEIDQRAEAERQRAETERERAEAEKARADIERQHADMERQRAEAEKARAESERARAERLIKQLQALGIEPETR